MPGRAACFLLLQNTFDVLAQRSCLVLQEKTFVVFFLTEDAPFLAKHGMLAVALEDMPSFATEAFLCVFQF